MQSLKPSVQEITSLDGHEYPVVFHSAKAMVNSLLTSSFIKDDNNLLFPDMSDPLAPPPPTLTHKSDIDTGEIYRNAYKELCTGKPKNHIICGVIIYIDKLAIDRHGHLSLEPVVFTLSIFNQLTWNMPQAWHPLGYIPNLGLMSKAETKHNCSSPDKVQLYHDILSIILQSLKDLQNEGHIPFEFEFGGKEYKVFLHSPLLAVLGDTESHDQLCGRYNSRNLNVARLCRHCDIPTEDTSNVDYDWDHIMPSQIEDLVNARNKQALQTISQHPIRNAFYHGLCLGGNPRGIYGMTPAEPLHVLELGLFQYAVEGFCVDLGYTAGSKSYPKILQQIDSWARPIGQYLSHQSDRSLPRTYFPNGITGGTKLAGHEMNGVLLVLLILCNMESSRTIILTNISPYKLRGWIELLELLLSWRWWLKQKSISMEEIQASKTGMLYLLKLFKKVVNRQNGSGMIIIKFHLCTHFYKNMMLLGVVSNIDTGPMESNHRINAKSPGERTQMQAEGFELQTSNQYVQDLILETAADYILPMDKSCLKAKIIPKKEPHLQGAKFTIKFGDETITGDMNPLVKLEWDKSHIVASSYPAGHITWLCNNILSDLGPLSQIRGCTEHARTTPRGGKYLFRAHPSYRKAGQWHDWALFTWQSDDDTTISIPGHIVTFLHLTENQLRLLASNSSVVGDEPVLYAMIESLIEPLPDTHKIIQDYSIGIKRSAPHMPSNISCTSGYHI